MTHDLTPPDWRSARSSWKGMSPITNKGAPNRDSSVMGSTDDIVLGVPRGYKSPNEFDILNFGIQNSSLKIPEMVSGKTIKQRKVIYRYIPWKRLGDLQIFQSMPTERFGWEKRGLRRKARWSVAVLHPESVNIPEGHWLNQEQNRSTESQVGVSEKQKWVYDFPYNFVLLFTQWVRLGSLRSSNWHIQRALQRRIPVQAYSVVAPSQIALWDRNQPRQRPAREELSLELYRISEW